jgi:hypothetical protein
VLTDGVRVAAEGVLAVSSMVPETLGWRCEAEREELLRCRVRRGTGACESLGSAGSWYPALEVEVEDMDVVLATEELCARRADSSRVSLLTCAFCRTLAACS